MRTMSFSLDEFLEVIRKTHTKDEILRVELAIDGIFWREPDSVIARYSRFPRYTIKKLRTQVTEDNNKDYFTI